MRINKSDLENAVMQGANSKAHFVQKGEAGNQQHHAAIHWITAVRVGARQNLYPSEIAVFETRGSPGLWSDRTEGWYLALQR